jgi:hypothetical protein
VRLGGRQVGIAATTIDTLAEGLSIDDRLTLDVPAENGKRSRRLLNRTTALLSRNLHVRSWRTTLVDDTRRSALSGTIEGDSALVLVIASGTAAETLSVRLDRPLILPLVLPFRLQYAGNLRAGGTFESSTFDPVALRFRTDRVRIGPDSLFVLPDSAVFDSAANRWVAAHADTVRAWRLDGDEGGIPVRRWIDGQGLVVYASTPFGFTIERSAFEIVSANYRKRRAAVKALAGSVSLNEAAASNPVAAPAPDEIVLGVTDPADSAFRVRLSSGQRLVWAGTRPLATDSVEYEDSLSFAGYLAAEPLVQIDDPLVRAVATRLAGNGDARATIERLATRVRRVRQVPRESAPWSAARVIATDQGDSESRINLFIALARSIGIPARRAAGLVRTGASYSLSRWAEVYLEGWTPVELAPGVPSGAFRVRLTTGMPGQPLNLIPLVGQIRVEEAVSRKP